MLILIHADGSTQTSQGDVKKSHLPSQLQNEKPSIVVRSICRLKFNYDELFLLVHTHIIFIMGGCLISMTERSFCCSLLKYTYKIVRNLIYMINFLLI